MSLLDAINRTIRGRSRRREPKRPRRAPSSHRTILIGQRRFNFVWTPSGDLVMREHRSRRTVTIVAAELVLKHDQLKHGSLML